MQIAELQELGKEIRRISVQLAHDTNTSHTGGALSMADILAVLYSGVINVNPKDANNPDRDRFILSKGHCSIRRMLTIQIETGSF